MQCINFGKEHIVEKNAVDCLNLDIKSSNELHKKLSKNKCSPINDWVK